MFSSVSISPLMQHIHSFIHSFIRSLSPSIYNLRNRQHCSVTLLSALFVFISTAVTLFMPGSEDKVCSLCLTLRAHSGHFDKFPCILNGELVADEQGGGLYGQ